MEKGVHDINSDYSEELNNSSYNETDSEIHPNFSSDCINCNLIINYLPHDINDVTLKRMFEECGEIVSSKVVNDKITKKSLGYGFVRFIREEDATLAIERFNGYNMGQKTLKVSVARPPSHDIKDCKLYVTNLPRDYGESEVFNLFREFGEIIECRVLKNRNTGQNKGVAFVQFNVKAQANNALSLNGCQLEGSMRPLAVKYAEDQHRRKEISRGLTSHSVYQRYPLGEGGIADYGHQGVMMYPPDMGMMQKYPMGQPHMQPRGSTQYHSGEPAQYYYSQAGIDRETRNIPVGAYGMGSPENLTSIPGQPYHQQSPQVYQLPTSHSRIEGPWPVNSGNTTERMRSDNFSGGAEQARNVSAAGGWYHRGVSYPQIPQQPHYSAAGMVAQQAPTDARHSGGMVMPMSPPALYGHVPNPYIAPSPNSQYHYQQQQRQNYQQQHLPNQGDSIPNQSQPIALLDTTSESHATIVIRNLPPEIELDLIRSLFAPYGNIISLDINLNNAKAAAMNSSNREEICVGHASIIMNRSEAELAVQKVDRVKLFENDPSLQVTK